MNRKLLAITLVALLALMASSIAASANPAGTNLAGSTAAPANPSTSGRDFEDVPPSNLFYTNLHNIYLSGIVGGYSCGGSGEPCIPPENLPYYRPGAAVTRGQMAKFVDNTRSLPGIHINPTVNIQPIYANTAMASTAAVQGVSSGVGTDRTASTLGKGMYTTGTGIANSVGLVATSAHDNALWIDTGNATNYYGINTPNGGATFGTSLSNNNGVYINGPLTVVGAKTGYVVDIMRNTGTTDVHTGEIVAMGGASAEAPQIGEIPVASVSAASGTYNTAVMGVVDMRWIPADPTAPEGSKARTGYYDDKATAIRPGEYMGVVTLGAYKAVKVDASNGPIHVGDLLTTGSQAGLAMKATDKLASVGAVVGKAMGNLESGTGTIPVMVSLK